MTYRIRPFGADDADALAGLAVRAILTIGPRAYSHAQVAVWAAKHGDAMRYLARAEQGDAIIVAADGADRPVAYALLEPTGEQCLHLDHLYCDPDHTRRGLGDRLLDAAEAAARRSGATRLFTEASEIARPTFERAGYRLSHRRDFEVDGIAIHNFAMEKILK